MEDRHGRHFTPVRDQAGAAVRTPLADEEAPQRRGSPGLDVRDKDAR